MSDDRAVDAALAIDDYVAGLRAELGTLTASEAADLVGEVRAMLLDASLAGPESALAEMARLGKPSELAAELLAERGVLANGRMPVSTWWRIGIAATIDLAVGLALPAWIVVALYGIVTQIFSSDTTAVASARGVLLALLAALTGLLAFRAWNIWKPWRVGGRSQTAGMAVAGVAVVKVGGDRSVVATSDLAAAGLPLPERPRLRTWLTIAVALLVLAWTASMAVGGALDPSGAGVVARYAGSETAQEEAVRAQVGVLYTAAVTASQATEQDWPPMADDWHFAVHLDTTMRDMLSTRFKGTAEPNQAYRIRSVSAAGPGRWVVEADETPAKAPERRVRLTYALRIEWAAPGGQPQPDWVLADYSLE